ncbi:MAG: FAD-binding protein, partial [Rhodobiaceae bacterium]
MSDIAVSDLQQVQDAVQDAVAAKSRLELRAGGTKRHLGRAASYDAVLNVSAFAGIVDYQPEELVLTLRAGTPMDVVEAALAEARQILAFEPPDMTRILG